MSKYIYVNVVVSGQRNVLHVSGDYNTRTRVRRPIMNAAAVIFALNIYGKKLLTFFFKIPF